MFKTILTKMLFEKRWTLALWFVASTATIVGISMIFPPIRDTMGQMLGSVPESMKNWFGSAETWQTFAGFAGQEIYTQMSMLIVVMAIVFGAAFAAGDEHDGTLLMVLARPVRRSSLFVQKYAALFVMVTVVASTYFFGAVLGGWILSEPVPYAVFLQASVMVWLLGLSLATVTYAIGVATGRKGLAGVCVVIAEAILRKSENDMFDILLRSCRMTGVSRKFDELKRITEEARVAAKEANREELLEAMLKVVHKEITIMILDTAAKVAKDIATTMGVRARLTIHHGDAEEMAELLAAKEEFVKVVPPSGTVH
jgi:hypothetical protein